MRLFACDFTPFGFIKFYVFFIDQAGNTADRPFPADF
jgi:hypothetical protein